MKVLVTGAKGQLGYDVIRKLEENNIEYLGADRYNMDLFNEKQVKDVITEYKPDVIIHCAAYTAVDRAEDEKDICYKTNVLGTRYISEACKEVDAKMVYISTDYVFDGEGTDPFEVTDRPAPINYYGQSKYEGELEVQRCLDKYFIVRISWVFGIHGNNFVKTMLRLGKEKGEVSVVDDQIGSPTYTYDLAELLIKMIQTDKYGIYHATNEGYCSWYEFTCEIYKQVEISAKVNPIKTKDYITKAKRPKNSRLSKKTLAKSGFESLREWEIAISKMIEEIGK